MADLQTNKPLRATTPRWVKMLVMAGLAFAGVVLALHLFGGGMDHMDHMSSGLHHMSQGG